VRDKRLAGFKFRRQHPFGPYVLDFFCVRARLAIEIDGGQHWTDAQQRHDRRRSELIRERRVRELRFTNVQVLRETESVLEAIWLTLHDRLQPSP
jgi:adenine-specific DNA-methyltransferase